MLKKEVNRLKKILEEKNEVQSNSSDESRVLEESSIKKRKINHLRFKSSFTNEYNTVNTNKLIGEIKYVLYLIYRCFLQDN